MKTSILLPTLLLSSVSITFAAEAMSNSSEDDRDHNRRTLVETTLTTSLEKTETLSSDVDQISKRLSNFSINERSNFQRNYTTDQELALRSKMKHNELNIQDIIQVFEDVDLKKILEKEFTGYNSTQLKIFVEQWLDLISKTGSQEHAKIVRTLKNIAYDQRDLFIEQVAKLIRTDNCEKEHVAIIQAFGEAMISRLKLSELKTFVDQCLELSQEINVKNYPIFIKILAEVAYYQPDLFIKYNTSHLKTFVNQLLTLTSQIDSDNYPKVIETLSNIEPAEEAEKNQRFKTSKFVNLTVKANIFITQVKTLINNTTECDPTDIIEALGKIKLADRRKFFCDIINYIIKLGTKVPYYPDLIRESLIRLDKINRLYEEFKIHFQSLIGKNARISFQNIEELSLLISDTKWTWPEIIRYKDYQYVHERFFRRLTRNEKAINYIDKFYAPKEADADEIDRICLDGFSSRTRVLMFREFIIRANGKVINIPFSFNVSEFDIKLDPKPHQHGNGIITNVMIYDKDKDDNHTKHGTYEDIFDVISSYKPETQLKIIRKLIESRKKDNHIYHKKMNHPYLEIEGKRLNLEMLNILLDFEVARRLKGTLKEELNSYYYLNKTQVNQDFFKNLLEDFEKDQFEIGFDSVPVAFAILAILKEDKLLEKYFQTTYTYPGRFGFKWGPYNPFQGKYEQRREILKTIIQETKGYPQPKEEMHQDCLDGFGGDSESDGEDYNYDDPHQGIRRHPSRHLSRHLL